MSSGGRSRSSTSRNSSRRTLAPRLEVDLQRRLDERTVEVSWRELMRDLAEVGAVELTLEGRRNRRRTDLPRSAHRTFAAAGVRPPATVTALGPAQPQAPAPPEVETRV